MIGVGINFYYLVSGSTWGYMGEIGQEGGFCGVVLTGGAAFVGRDGLGHDIINL